MKNFRHILGLVAVLFIMTNTKAQTPLLQWAYNFGGTSNEEVYAQTTDASGNIYSTGIFSSTIDFNPGAGILNLSSVGGSDIFIQKLDRNGNFLWAKKIGGIWGDQAYDIAVDNSGNVFITGGFRNTVDFDPGTGVYNLVADNTIQSYAAFILKLNSSGDFQWAKAASTVSYGTGVDTDNSGNVYVTGYIQNWVDFGTTSIAGEIFFWKLDATGTQQWAKALDDTNGSSLQAGIHGLKVDATGNIYLTGRFDETQDFQPGTGTVNLVAVGGSDAFLLKLNTSGTLQWVKQFGSTGSETGYALHIDASNQIYITGTFQGITDLDPSSGTGTYSFISNGGTDVFVIKLSSLGNVIWGRGFGGTGSEWVWGNIATDINGNILFSGTFQNTVDFDPDLVTNYNITSNGGTDVFLEKLNSNGEFQWVKTYGSTSDESGWGLCYSSFDNSFYVGGGFYNTMDLVFSGNTTTLTSAGGMDIYILKLNECYNSSNTISPIACTSYTSPSGNYIWTTSNTYLDTITNSGGCDSIITVNLTIGDFTAPTANVPSLSNVAAQCSVVSLTAPTATDNCAGTITGTHDASLPITTQGTTVVTWTYDDGNGNSSTQTQNVIINDNTAPVADNASLTDVNAQCSISSLTSPTATDNCAGIITGIHNATLPITTQGTTVVTWTYDDGNGNSSTQTQNVIINDNIAPVADNASLTDVNAQCVVSSLTAPTATDNCIGTIAGIHNASLPITTQGTTVVTWTYDDGNGNISTQIQNVIISDNTAAVPDQGTLPTITEICSVASLTAPTATDNCSGLISGTHDATLPITSTTTITWTYDDGNGNISIQTQNVVISDNIAPVADQGALSNINEVCSVTSLTAPTATDNCAGSVTGTHDVSLPITTQGTTVVTWTYDDGNGNISTQTQNVIIADALSPVADNGSLSPFTAECQILSIPAPTATDNCAGTVTGTPNVTFPITTQGTFTITWTYNDGNGNTTMQTQSVIIDDVTAPVEDNAILPNINAECSVSSLAAPTATDNCASSITGTHNATLPINAQGTSVVTWTYNDGNGNTTTQTQNVIITPIDNGINQVDAVTLMANASGYQYQWLDCNNGYAIIPGANNQQFVALANGNYAVQVTQNGCTDTSACVNITGVGVDEFLNTLISIYPNPTYGNVTINLGQTHSNLTLHVKNTLGQVIQDMDYLSANQIEFNIVGDKGVYFVEIQTQDGNKTTLKVFKQ
ncbi:MAG: SBBP repeat-containing protein [Bacteroidota bacterium]